MLEDLSPFVMAALFIIATGIYLFSVLLDPSASRGSQRRALAAITALLSGVVGFIFGRAAGK